MKTCRRFNLIFLVIIKKIYRKQRIFVGQSLMIEKLVHIELKSHDD